MKKTIRLFIIGFLFVPILILGGCDIFPENEIAVTSYNFNQITTSYETEDIFSLNGSELMLTYSDGSTSTITLNNGMIKFMPNMATAGTKIIVIIYEGKEYSFSVNVQPNEALLELNAYTQKLADFLASYNSGNQTAELNAFLTTDLYAKFLENENYLTESLLDLQGFDSNVLADAEGIQTIYEEIINSIINSSFELNTDEAKSLEDLLFELNLQNTLDDLVTNLKNIDYYEEVVDTVFTEEASYYLTPMTEFLTSVLQIENSSGYTQIYSILYNQLYLTVLNNGNFDIQTLTNSLQTVFNTYSGLDSSSKSALNSILDAIQENPEHAISAFFEGLRTIIIDEVILSYSDSSNTLYGLDNTVEALPDSEQRIVVGLINDYFDTLNDALLLLENFYQTTDYITALTQFNNYLEILEAINEDLIPYSHSLPFQTEYILDATQIIENCFTLNFEQLNTLYGIVDNLDYALSGLLGILDDDSTQSIALNDFIETYLSALFYGSEIDVLQMISEFVDIVNFDDGSFVSNYQIYGTPYLLTYYVDGYCAGLEDSIVAQYSQNYYDNLLTAITNVTKAIDEIHINGFNNLHAQLDAATDTLLTLTLEYSDSAPYELVDLLNILFDSNVSYPQPIINALTKYKTEFVETLMNVLSTEYGLEETSSTYLELYSLIDGATTDIINETFDIENFIANIANLIEGFNSEPATVFAYAIGSMLMITSGEEIDYNEVFSFIELPAEIESIDYNQLVATITSGETYDIFSLNNVETTFIEDAFGNIIGETLTLTLNIDFNLMITELSGSVTLTLEFVY